MLQGDIRRDFVEPYFFLGEDIDLADMSRVLRLVEAEAMASLDSENIPTDKRSAQHAVDVRYESQEYCLTVPLRNAGEPIEPSFLDTLGARFAHLYEDRYGHSTLGAPIEVVSLRTRVIGALDTVQPPALKSAATQEFPHHRRTVVFDGAEQHAIVVERDDLAPGHAFDGPAVVLEATATTVVPPGFAVSVDKYGSLVIRNNDTESGV